MSTMSQAATRPAMSLTSGGFFRRVGTWFGTWAYVLVDHLHRRAAIKMLRQMNERELRDIGLTREQTHYHVFDELDDARSERINSKLLGGRK